MSITPIHIRSGLTSVIILIASSCGTAALAAGASDGDWHVGIENDNGNGESRDYVPSSITQNSKQAAILGGQLSALEAIQATQNKTGHVKNIARTTFLPSSSKASTAIRASNHSSAIVSIEARFPKFTLTSFNLPENNRLHPSGSAPGKFRIIEENNAIWQTGLKPIAFASDIPIVDRSSFGLPLHNFFELDLLSNASTESASVSYAAPIAPKLAVKKTGVRQRKMPEYRPTVYNGRPDVFGSTALSVRSTPLDRKWNRVRISSNASRAFLHAATGGIGSRSKDRLSKIQSINKWVNDRVKYADDRDYRGTGDHWAKAEETLRSKKGDCEDYAIAKMQLLKASGIASKDIFLVIAKDLVRRADHALLVVQHDGRLLVLDSETDLILEASQVQDYRPIMSYSSAGKWLHGYKAKPSTKAVRTAALTLGR